MTSERIIGGIFILLVMFWAYLLLHSLLQSVVKWTLQIITAYYKAKYDWLNSLARDTLANTKESEEKE